MKTFTYTLAFATWALLSCDSKPKVIVADTKTESPANSAIPNSTVPVTAKNPMGDMHQVQVTEVLQAERYTYLKVKENAESFWIATAKLEAKVGEQYFYKGGLLKTNFESVEHKRVFDKIYLVSEIINAAAHPGSNADMPGHNHGPEATPSSKDFKPVAGTIALKDLFAQAKKYERKTIFVAGTCVKANYGIMNKNWYHIQDGTKYNGKLCDLTITSNENIPLGAQVAFEGKLVLNKDFGAGYVYEILVEDGHLK